MGLEAFSTHTIELENEGPRKEAPPKAAESERIFSIQCKKQNILATEVFEKQSKVGLVDQILPFLDISFPLSRTSLLIVSVLISLFFLFI